LLGEETTLSGTHMITGLKSTQLVAGAHYRDVRGFFSMPYTPIKPPKGI